MVQPVPLPTDRVPSLHSPAPTNALAGVARVPIHVARHVHYDRQHDEERDCAHEQRVVLLPQGDVEKCVNAREPCTDHERADTAAQEKAAIPRDQHCRCDRRDQVSPAESDKFRNR